jgi:hypothetical protein
MIPAKARRRGRLRVILPIPLAGDEANGPPLPGGDHAAPDTIPKSQRSQWPQAGASASSSLK